MAIKNVIIAVLAAVVVVGGGAAAYFATQNGDDSNQTNQTQQNAAGTQDTQQSETAEQSYASLISRALAGETAVQCTFEQDGNPGTAYITSEANFRVDVRTDEGNAHMIKKADAAYLWTEGESGGFVFSGEAYDEDFEQRFDSFNPEEIEENADNDNAQNVDCHEASIDDSRFALPQNVEFQSWEDMFSEAFNQQQ